MRKSGTITINDKVITINELTVKQMLQFNEQFACGDMASAIKTVLPLLTDASETFFLDLAPSELALIYAKVKEVNEYFFEWTGLETILSGVRQHITTTIQESLNKLSAASSLPVMAKPSGATATDSL